MDYIGFAYSAIVAGGGIFGEASKLTFQSKRVKVFFVFIKATLKRSQFLHSLPV